MAPHGTRQRRLHRPRLGAGRPLELPPLPRGQRDGDPVRSGKAKCSRPEHAQIWDDYCELDGKGDEIGDARERIYITLRREVHSILARSGVNGPETHGERLAGEGRVMAIVEA